MPHPESAPLAPTADTPPDWATTPDDFPCPLCSYNLRGLTTPRCPECGYSFTWSTLATARQSTHPYLFEHRPTPWTLLRTLTAGLLPRRFWRTLTAFHTVRPCRLAAYHLLTLSLTFLPYLVIIVAAAHYYSQAAPAFRGTTPFVTAVARELFDIPSTLIVVLLFATWPWAMLLALLLYRRSMWRASVRTAHLHRCVLYAWDGTAWAGLVIASLLVCSALLSQSLDPIFDYSRALGSALFLAWLVLNLIATYRLVVAYGYYLKMRRAWLAIPLAAVVVLLVYANVVFFVAQLFRL